MAQNGRLPASALTSTQIGGRLRKDAAYSADRLALAFYQHFGRPLDATDTYRDYATQVAVKKSKGVFAAVPGTSNHGWGVAVDFASNINRDTSAEHRWMEQNAGAYGWENPLWARNASKADGQYEPWHWEYSAARDRRKDSARVHNPRAGEVGLGDSGASVKAIQTLLNARLAGPGLKVDGGYGWGTATAVRKFQSSRGLPMTGVVNQTTRDRLENKPAKRNRPFVFLHKDTNKHAETKILQTFLNTLPGVSIKVDGFYGDRTEAAVKKFQRLSKLGQTGKVNVVTKRALEKRGVKWK